MFTFLGRSLLVKLELKLSRVWFTFCLATQLRHRPTTQTVFSWNISPLLPQVFGTCGILYNIGLLKSVLPANVESQEVLLSYFPLLFKVSQIGSPSSQSDVSVLCGFHSHWLYLVSLAVSSCSEQFFFLFSLPVTFDTKLARPMSAVNRDCLWYV